MRRRLIMLVLGGGMALAALSTGPASAVTGGPTVGGTSAILSGAQENPPADPNGTGQVGIFLDARRGSVCFGLSVANIAPATAAHIHFAPAGSNGPVVVPLPAPTTGSSAGCVSANPALVQNIIDHPADYYVNVHNAEYPGGAIRGQLA
ncbi:MAG: hypothetical protein QOG43_665 [Actinomycetota bacterium]|jgi:hypothetical protein|nr:hypothetical protein [Actinomycetota bacterium]